MTEQRTARDPEQHLYLLFDDWHSGYSIRKVSLSRRSAKRAEQPLASGSGEGAEQPLPGVFMRVQALRGYSEYFTSAFGTKIAAMHPGPTGTGVPMIDVRDLIFISGPMANNNIIPIYFPIGDKRLFVLDFATFDCFQWMPENSEQPWVWEGLPYPPFERLDVSSYGVQPDGCILISTKSGATFVFDTNDYVWKPYGNFALPFTGRGYYDTSLEGFVGLSKEDREGGPSKDPETLGYLYCCTGADFKRTREKVYSNNPAERHVSATLLHMWPGKFCLVECVSIDNGGAERFMYRLKTLCLVYDEERDLKLKHCHVRCYSPPREATTDFIRKDPAAFWL